MAEIGKINKLEIIKEVDFGVYLDGGDIGEILLPKKFVPESVKTGDEIEVFIYHDSEGRIIATTQKPKALVGEFAYLEVLDINKVGAFLDWGLQKDLFVPFREQLHKMEVGKSYVVYVYFDFESERIAASSKIEKFLDNLPVDFEEGEEVDLIIYAKTDLGYKTIIDEVSTGLIYKNEVFQELSVGQQLKGYIKKVREDEKLDLSLQKPGVGRFEKNEQVLLVFMNNNNGFMFFNDKSTPEEIYKTFHMSKKDFKKAIGALYKNRLISLEEQGIRLLKD